MDSKHLGCTCCVVEENLAELCAVSPICMQHLLYSAEAAELCEYGEICCMSSSSSRVNFFYVT